MTNNIAKIRAALEWGEDSVFIEALAALAELERAAAQPDPKFEAPEVDDAMCERVCAEYQRLESNARITGSRNVASFGHAMIAAVRSELGPTLGLAVMREPTPEECRQICDRITQWANRRNDPCSLSPDGIRHAQESHGRAMFDAVRAVMWPKSEGL